MQVGRIASAKDRPELGHRSKRNPSSFSNPTIVSLMGNKNLDDVMQGSMNSKSSLMASGSLKRPILAIRTVSPLVQQTNDNTSPTPSMTMGYNSDPVPKSRSRLRDMELRTDPAPANGHGWNGMAKTENLIQHERKERKRNEPSISSKMKDILEWRTMKLGTGVRLERQDRSGSANKTEKAGGMRDLWKSGRKNKGPKAGQLYEIVNQHIIEDSMERTVTLSTWREQVDEGRGSDSTDTTDVYYIGPDGYAREGAYMTEVAYLGRRPLESRNGSRKETQRKPYGLVEANRGPSSTITKSQVNSGYRHAQYYDTDPLRSKDTTFSASNEDRHTRSRVKDGGARINPSRAPLTQLKVPDGPFMQRYQESTPIEKQLPQLPSFHPTCSGSTISSIRSASAATDFENFLDGCKPSLVHVSDILRTLGIHKVEDLKAVVRLSPEMRDREVKEVALRLGMTVVEWATLVDRIFQLRNIT